MTLIVSGILIAMVVIMGMAWAVQRAAGNGGWVDVFWTYGTGACCSMAALIPVSPGAGITWRQTLVATLVALWSLRLGTYVALRVARGPEDLRYATIRHEWGTRFQLKMAGLTVVQAPVSALLGMAILFAARESDTTFRVNDGLGVLILLVAIAGESLADGQMKRFKSNPAHHGLVCNQGLWAWSRHPNYFFEAVLWLAYPVMGLDLHRPYSWLSCLAPISMFLILRFGTGVPPLEAAMLRSKGEAYRLYQQRVSPLLPRPPRRF